MNAASFTNVRIANKHGHLDGEWYVLPGDTKKADHIKRVLRANQKAEPQRGWHIELRGEVMDWHAVKPEEFNA